MRTWFNPKKVMDDCEEGHAYLIGLSDGICFGNTDWSKVHKWSLPKEVEGELHYYKWGVLSGRLVFYGLVYGIVAMILRAI